MNRTTRQTLRRRLPAAARVTGLLLLWMLVHLLAAVPQLHHDLHDDAASPDHRCLLTEFAGGFFEQSPVHQPADWSSVVSYAVIPSVSQVPNLDTLFLPLAARPPPFIPLSFVGAGS